MKYHSMDALTVVLCWKPVSLNTQSLHM